LDVVSRARQLVILLCLAALLFAALSPASSHHLVAVLIPIWILFCPVAPVRRVVPAEALVLSVVFVPRAISPRAPPAA